MAVNNGSHPGKWQVFHAGYAVAQVVDQLQHGWLLQVVVAQHDGCGPEGVWFAGQAHDHPVAEGEGFAVDCPARQIAIGPSDDGQIQNPLAQQFQAAFFSQPSLRQGAAGMPQPLQLAAAPGQAQQLGGVAQRSQDGLVGVGSAVALGFAEVQPQLVAGMAVEAGDGALVAVAEGRHATCAARDLQEIQDRNAIDQDVAHTFTCWFQQRRDRMNPWDARAGDLPVSG